MGSEWKPDDSFLDRERKEGTDAVDNALRRHNLSLDRIFTSRDRGVDLARYELRREHMPPGWRSWQLPLYTLNRPTFFFLSTGEAGAVLPAHSHDTAQLRIVVTGSVIYNGVELKPGDWMYIPKGEEYSVSAAVNPGAGILYSY